MIVTLTVNPAIDRTITVDRLAFEDRAYILSTRESPGGRGINASCVIHSFGGETLAVLPAGGESGKRFEEFLHACGFPMVVVPVRNDVRTNLTITDRHGLAVKLNERGPAIDKSELAEIEKTLWSRIGQASWLMICGSLPPGVPAEFYARLIQRAREHNVKTFLDTDGEPLQAGIEAKPTVVSPNQEEAERLLHKAMLTRPNYLHAIERIQTMGAESVILSLGSRGAIGAFEAGMVEVLPPRVDVLCPIGAGDALAAAFLWSMEQDEDHQNALRWGVAAGTASASLPGMKFANLAQTREIYQKVEVRGVE